MTIIKNILNTFLVMCLGSSSAFAQISDQQMDSILTPDSVETSIGTLQFLDGAPLPETAQKVFDNLDRMRGVDAFIKGIPAASVYRLVTGLQSIGAKQAHQVVVFEGMLGAESLFLTGGNTTMYVFPIFDLERDGPTVMEVPAGMLGMIDDAWFHYMADVGPFGPDKGKGGKFLLVPPQYDGEIPDGYFVVHSSSYRFWSALCASVKNGQAAALKNIKEHLKIYPLSKQEQPPKMEFINGTGKAFNTIHANNFEFYNELNAVIQKEPLNLIDVETRGLFAAIGIEKGKPFNPNERMKKILIDASAIGNATVRSNVWYPRIDSTMKGIEVYPAQDSAWIMGWVDKNVFYNGKNKHTLNSDARAFFHYFATGVTPAMAVEIPGKGSDYAIGFVDSNKLPLDGNKTYRVRMPANVPVANFWSFTVFDAQTRSMLKSPQPYPSLVSFEANLKKNTDGTTDIYFAPKSPKGMESNWIQTVPGKSWFTALRMYGPLKPWLNRSWKLSEIELIE